MYYDILVLPDCTTLLKDIIIGGHYGNAVIGM